MSRFFVGQRVRLVRGYFHPENVGIETRIIAASSEIFEVQFDKYRIGNELAWILDTGRGAWEHQLEPITDANDKLAWTDERCVWTPEHLRTTHA